MGKLPAGVLNTLGQETTVVRTPNPRLFVQ
jgi:hypothetical protein